MTSMVLPVSKQAPRNCTMLASLRSSRMNTSLRCSVSVGHLDNEHPRLPIWLSLDSCCDASDLLKGLQLKQSIAAEIYQDAIRDGETHWTMP